MPATLAEWWTRFQSATHEEREAMLRPEEAPAKRRRGRGRGRSAGKQDHAAA